ncbi:MAG: hypothetical protein BWX95_00987 [Bacteroidetes bacterium ADurb.Bin141]|nr:DUF3098 domain-containing protein [Bacteroidia bacterium]MBX3107276.1 DUF3098 domain-containing protein [Bacteroidota bacterium]MCE7955364.1 DUF3098 domain-containing protein [Bacteroidetes bacterium CHB6]OQB63477.1 MAG: hypothetical protein BWX95_00987 [Bacteroidetes bacterium ADurb.Bin141]MBV6453492.1 hypothetical protein [Bacteroidia bacterium]
MAKGKTVTTEKKVVSKSTATAKDDMLFAFGRINYILMIAGIVLIFLGYVLMSGGGSDDPNVFNPAIFDTQRITIAPIVVILGYALEVVAILIKAKD